MFQFFYFIIVCLFGSIVFLIFTNLAYSQIPDTLEQGWQIINDGNLGNCGTCHQLRSSNYSQPTQKQGNFGPSLVGVGRRYSREILLQWVTDARQISSGTLMPPYGSLEGIEQPIVPRTILSAEQIKNVVDVLQTLR